MVHRPQDDVPDYTPSSQCNEDMSSQGASNHEEIVFTEVSVFLGRAAGQLDLVEGTKRGAYGSPPQQSPGGRNAIKFKTATFDTAMDLSTQQRSADPLASFILQTTHLLSRNDHPFAGRASANLGQWWMRTSRLIGILSHFARRPQGIR